MNEAYRLGHSYVGTEHVLLGILRDTTSDASVILAHHGVTSDRTQNEIERSIAAKIASAGGADSVARVQGPALSADTKHIRLAMLMSALALIVSVAALLLASTHRRN